MTESTPHRPDVPPHQVQPPPPKFQAGQRVRHREYGEGTVARITTSEQSPLLAKLTPSGWAEPTYSVLFDGCPFPSNCGITAADLEAL